MRRLINSATVVSFWTFFPAFMEDVPLAGMDLAITAPPTLRLQQERGLLSIFFQGDWTWRAPQPALAEVEQALAKGVTEVSCHAEGIKQWDSSLLALLLHLRRHCEKTRIGFRAETLPPQLKQLLDNVPPVEWPSEPASEEKTMYFFDGAYRALYFTGKRARALDKAGLRTMQFFDGAYRALYFTGECAQALAKVCRFPRALRWPECRMIMQECGPASLGIVGLISFLTGCILAWQGALQLRQFGAEIYVADLVGVALVREMGPIMVAIVLAGRIGASFAAHLATMEGSEEVDALRTWGFSPVQFLVLPRIVALVCMMPLLVLYADLLGIIGGLSVAAIVLDLSKSAFMMETWKALHLGDLEIGLLKSVVFAAGVAGIGCASGLRAERSADGVGVATTSSVVKSILFIIVVDAIFGACSHPSTL